VPREAGPGRLEQARARAEAAHELTAGLLEAEIEERLPVPSVDDVDDELRLGARRAP